MKHPKRTHFLRPVLVLYFLACVGILFALSYEYFTPEGTDQERLGQLGDFIGGVLNPILGFFTVALLIQETVRSHAMLELSRFEATRKQAEDALLALYEEQDQLFGRPLSHKFNDGEGNSSENLEEAYLKDLSRPHALLANYIKVHRENEQLPIDLKMTVGKLEFNLSLAKELTSKIVSLLEESSEPARDFWIYRFLAAQTKCARCGISDVARASSIAYLYWKNEIQNMKSERSE